MKSIKVLDKLKHNYPKGVLNPKLIIYSIYM